MHQGASTIGFDAPVFPSASQESSSPPFSASHRSADPFFWSDGPFAHGWRQRQLRAVPIAARSPSTPPTPPLCSFASTPPRTDLTARRSRRDGNGKRKGPLIPPKRGRAVGWTRETERTVTWADWTPGPGGTGRGFALSRHAGRLRAPPVCAPSRPSPPAPRHARSASCSSAWRCR